MSLDKRFAPYIYLERVNFIMPRLTARETFRNIPSQTVIPAWVALDAFLNRLPRIESVIIDMTHDEIDGLEGRSHHPDLSAESLMDEINPMSKEEVAKIMKQLHEAGKLIVRRDGIVL